MSASSKEEETTSSKEEETILSKKEQTMSSKKEKKPLNVPKETDAERVLKRQKRFKE